MTANLVILPPTKLELVDCQRPLEICRKRFGMIDIVAPIESIEYYRQSLSYYAIDLYPVESALKKYAVFIHIEGYEGEVTSPGPHAFHLHEPEKQRVYLFLMSSRLKLIQPNIYDTEESPHVEAHIFSKLSSRSNGFLNFPYGPLFSDVEVGPVNEFGFRIPNDYMKFSERDLNHKLIVILGGSAAFSFYCLPEEMFSTLLEDKLNVYAKVNYLNKKFTVLNFGMHDNVIIQEMLTYILFVHSLKPDFVIAHDAHNDVYYGLQNDNTLLNKYELIYQRYSEEWSKILHGTRDIPTPELYSMAVGVHNMNMPMNVIETFLSRKRQFESIVRANGAEFIFGIQPLHCSKRALSRREKLKYRQAERRPEGRLVPPAQQKFLKALYFTYDMLSERLTNRKDINLVDFNRLFKKFGEDTELLWDHCHTSPAGDEVIAQQYCNLILEMMGC